MTVDDVPSLRRALRRWYRSARRDLPWRRTTDPYAIWVSEAMLQQTQVATVIPYYERFLERFPDVERLAAADEESVLAAWSGLGYYRRARDLRAGAREVVARFGGRIPDDPAALRSLPGVGRYTAGAIASLAFRRRAPVVDGNVARVLCRLRGLRGPAERGPGDRHLWSLAAAFADAPRPDEINQALMELGALVCTPRKPSCDLCPWRNACEARRSGDPRAYPTPPRRRATERVDVAVLVARRGDAWLLSARGATTPLRGEWDLPAVECDDTANDPVSAIRSWAGTRGLSVDDPRVGPTVSHGILHRRLRLQSVRARLRGRVSAHRDLRWIPAPELERRAVSGATWKVLRAQ